MFQEHFLFSLSFSLSKRLVNVLLPRFFHALSFEASPAFGHFLENFDLPP